MIFRMPWKYLEDSLNQYRAATDDRIVSLFNHGTQELKKVKESCFQAIAQWRQSEQIKYNDIERRLKAMEAIVAAYITHEDEDEDDTTDQ